MTTTKYFSDTQNGTVEIAWTQPMRNAQAEALFPGVKIKRYDSFSRLVGKSDDGVMLPITRFVCYKATPSLHQCSAKCRGGKCGGTCECQCGGKNHGVGV